MLFSKCYNVVLLFIIAILFFSCVKNKPSKNFTLFKKSSLEFTPIKIDSFYLNGENNSGSYFFKVVDSKLHFIDKLFGLIKTYDSRGKLLFTGFGKKNYPQLGELYTFSFYDGFYYITDNLFMYKLDSSFKLIKSGRIEFKPNILSLNPDEPNPEQIMFYQLNYSAMNSFEGFNNYLIIPIEMELPKLNAFNTNNYYKIAYNFGLLDTATFKVKKLFNNWSDPYKLGKNFPFLTRNSYAIDNDKIFINHEADSLIYVIDKNLEPLYKFGYRPKKLNDNYRETKKLAEAFDPSLSPTFRKQFGFFKEIVVNKEMVLRTFYTGITTEKGGKNFGIQIYKNFELINEIMFDRELEIIGFINSEFYMYDASIKTSENLKIYKFNIEL